MFAMLIAWCVVTCTVVGNAFLFNGAQTRIPCYLAPKITPVVYNYRLSPLAMDSTVALPVQPSPSEYKFESNVARVMDIIINSLYSNKDVFLRELISNAADACDKRLYLTAGNELKGPPLGIKIYTDREKGTLTIEDTGIGMNKEDLITNLGRIAESGTKKFTQGMSGKEKDNSNLIGQFGVGFYSGFLVASKIEVVSKGNSSEQLRWSASMDSLDKYTITPDDSEPIAQSGTRIIMHLKDECEQYLDDVQLKDLIEKYSEFIAVPIELQRNVTKPEIVTDTAAPPLEDGTYPTKTVMTKVPEWYVVNSKKPLWLRSKKNVTEAEYLEFYQQTFKAFDQPVAHAHFAIEGGVDFKSLLYLPSEIPYELTRDMFANSARSMRLYVKRVFINDKFEDLIPRWLLFVRGVVDSEELPLNVGREILQQSKSLRVIKQRLVKKSIEMMAELALRNETEYMKFYKNFGKYLKVGMIEDETSRVDLTPLLRFFSSHTSSNSTMMTSIPDYVARMKPEQQHIYYVVGETRAQAAMAPALEKVKQKGYEVIYVSEPLDEMTLQHLDNYGGKTMSDVGKEQGDQLSEEEKREKDKTNEEMEPLRDWVKDILGDKITRVEVSTRLVESPATLVQSEFGVSPTMQKYLKAQSLAETDDTKVFGNIFNQAVFEINPNHAIVKNLDRIRKTDKKNAEAIDTVHLLFNTAALAAGYMLDNAADYTQMVTKMLSKLSSL